MANKLIIIVGAFILSLVLGLTLLWPKYQNLQILQASIKEKESELQSKENYFSKIKEISVKLQQYQEPLTKISSALPQDSSLPSLVGFLQSGAAETGLILEKISWAGTTASPEKAALRETQFTFQLTGSYEAFKNFLAVLEGSARMLEVQTISISTSVKESKESSAFAVDIKAYSY